MRHELAVLLGTDANWTVMFVGSPSFLVHVSPSIVWDFVAFHSRTLPPVLPVPHDV